MILRDVICRTNDCEQEGEPIEILCEGSDRAYCACCGCVMENQITTGKAILFREGWYPDIDHVPLYIRTKKQLKQECEQRGLTSIYAHEW